MTDVGVGVVCRRELEQGTQGFSVGTTGFDAWLFGVVEE